MNLKLLSPFAWMFWGLTLAILLGSCSDQKLIIPVDNQFSTITGKVYPRGIPGFIYLDNGGQEDTVEIDLYSGEFVMDSVLYGHHTMHIVLEGFGTKTYSWTVESYKENLGTFEIENLPEAVSLIFPNDSAQIDSFLISSSSIYDISKKEISITFRFKKEMDLKSLDTSLKMSEWLEDLELVPDYSSSGDKMTLNVPIREVHKHEKMNFKLTTRALTYTGDSLEFEVVRTYFIDREFMETFYHKSFISSFYPADGTSEVSVTPIISIKFKEKMVRSSVENAINMAPQTPLNMFWKAPTSGDELWLQFANPLEFGTQYKVILKEGMQTLDSVEIGSELSFQFTTRLLELTHMSPLNGKVNVGLAEDLEYKFNNQINPTQFESAFSILPQVGNLTFTYNDDSSDVYVKHALFEPGTDYAVLLDSTLFGGAGEESSKFITQNFTTTEVPFSSTQVHEWVQSVFPMDTNYSIPVSGNIQISFVEAMNRLSVEEHLVVSPFILYETQWSVNHQNQEVLTIDPVHPLRSGSVYGLDIDSGYQTILGDPGNAFSTQFRTQNMQLVNFYPLHGSVNVLSETRMEYTFNADVDTSEFLNKILFEPEVDSLWISNYETFTYSGTTQYKISLGHLPLLKDTAYTVTLPSSLTDVYGIPMGKEYNLDFNTAK